MRDRQKAIERSRRYRERKKIERFGPEAAGRNMSGRHGNHARGERNGRWNRGQLISSEGYILRRVPRGSPNSFGPPGCIHAYAYEHVVVASEVLRRPIAYDEVVHHKNGIRTDNRIANLEVLHRGAHASEHANHPNARDYYGRFKGGARSGDLRVREFPEGLR